MSITLVELPYRDNLTAIAFKFKDENLVILDSPNTPHPDGRWSILAADPIASLNLNSNTAEQLESFKKRTQDLVAQLDHSPLESRYEHLPFTCGVIGVASYDLGITEPGINIKLSNKNKHPKAISHLFSWCYLWDHHEKIAYLVMYESHSRRTKSQLMNTYKTAPLATDQTINISAFQKHWDYKDYENAFNKTKNYIESGDVYQINLAQKYSADYSGDPLKAYEKLRNRAAAPFSIYWSSDQWSLVSSSPERFIKIQNNSVETKPIKGTRPNTGSADNISQLTNSCKDKAENLMIVDLLRNDISKHCTNVTVPKLFDIETYPTVHHMVSTIQGKLHEKSTNLDVYWDAFPGGSITGAPKKRAMEIIDELEEGGRSFYCGSVFYQSTNGHFDSNILIRSFIFKDHKVETWAGGGIVADSTVEDEYQECEDKIRKLMDWLK